MWLSTVHVERTLYGKSKLGWVTTCCRQPNSESLFIAHYSLIPIIFCQYFFGQECSHNNDCWLKKYVISHTTVSYHALFAFLSIQRDLPDTILWCPGWEYSKKRKTWFSTVHVNRSPHGKSMVGFRRLLPTQHSVPNIIYCTLLSYPRHLLTIFNFLGKRVPR